MSGKVEDTESNKKGQENGQKAIKPKVTEEFLKTVGNKIRRRELALQLKKDKKKVRNFQS